jgi:hypothetical protein
MDKPIPDECDDQGNTHIVEHLFIYDTQTGDVLLNNLIDESPIVENTHEEHCKPTD